MSVRQAVLALLAEGPTYGYQLRQEFEDRTGGTWPLNIGQVYTTIQRLERDGLVEEAGRRDDGSVIYALTDGGRAEAERWWLTPVPRGAPARDEVAMKLALALSAPGVDVAAVVQQQRTESLRAMRELTRRAAALPERPGRGELATALVLDAQLFAAEAEVRWLDHLEARVAASANGHHDPAPVRTGAGPQGRQGDPQR